MRAEQSRLGYEELHMKLVAVTKVDEAKRRLCTVPGVGPVTAGAITALAPDLSTLPADETSLRRWGLVLRQRSTGGKTRLGSVGNR